VRELIDCHIHTARCGHATGTLAQMVSAAVFDGLAGIVVTEHLPLPETMDADRRLSMPPEDLEVYAAEVTAIASRVKDLDVVLGAEADWLPGREDYCAQLTTRARAAGVRVLLGSVHFLEDWAFDDPTDLSGWDTRDVDEVWQAYFEQWCLAAASGDFDVMAHPDLPKKFGHRPTKDPAELYEAAATSAVRGGVIVEVSTAGLRKPVGELYPGPELLSAFSRHSVPATVGSDAHAPSEVGSQIGAAYDALALAGYERVAFPLGGEEMRWIEL
jgi:histidinol-phosphatase (PHP family)